MGKLGKVQGEGALLVGLGSGGIDLKELRVCINCGRGLEKTGANGGRSGVKDVGERRSGWHRSSVQPGSREGRQRRGEEFGGFAFGACVKFKKGERGKERKDRRGGRLNEQEYTVI